MPNPPRPDPIAAGAEARRLLRGAASATLATQSDGQPFASLVTPAMAPDLGALLLLSTLSEHTRHLLREPRCALLVVGTAEDANPQTAPRVTLTGLAEQVSAAEVPALKARWLARHPYAALYAGFGDFSLWRLRPGGALLVGGFARAIRLPLAALLPDPAALAAVAAAAADILDHMNAEHADALAAIATRRLGGPEGAWRMTGVDVDGIDLAGPDEAVRRFNFAAPAGNSGEVRQALVAATRAARAANG
ncbi:hypothetical protein C8P66_101327 [Humitalea rosea]|uniref:DUF2470 domain-containing protein n=1 Tax=Humitalea rosea TaxID=990373 RepID=A0A2W7IWH8_9PROT|nr:DUF2470 domain-containing protein [Humitalea rosea]PZW51108.1 hypothetical protein C8P66_101327 [Humitalea rosea]